MSGYVDVTPCNSCGGWGEVYVDDEFDVAYRAVQCPMCHGEGVES